MPHNPGKYLFDISDSCEFLLSFVAGHDLQDLKNDRGFRSAVERELMIIGEALWALSKTHPAIASRIPEYQRIIRFRHILVHGYDLVDSELVWVVLQEKLAVLYEHVSKLEEELA